MLFSSPVFIFLFLPIVLIGVAFVPKKWHNAFLLLSSLLFYFWGESFYIILLLASILINYSVALLFDTHWLSRKAFLAIGILLNLSFLLFYKYADWALDQVNWVIGTDLSVNVTHLPLGISFFTFQGISYLVDVYRRWSDPQPNLPRVALFISLFPQLIAGPIIRYHHLERQLAERTIKSDRFVSGIKRFIEGMVKKLVFADGLGYVSDQIFALPDQQVGFSLAWLASACFLYQVYLDFAAYSDMAIGLGRMLGFEIRENFHYPMREKTIRNFWRKWHMSLIQWFRDYPYSAMKKGKLRWANETIRLMMVFLLTGLWHGANWTFIFWGLIHGALLVLENGRWGRILSKWPVFLQRSYVYFVILVTGMLFRAENLSQALVFGKAMFGFGEDDFVPQFWFYFNAEKLTIMVLAFAGSLGLFLKLKDWFVSKIKDGEESMTYKNLELIWYVGLLILGMMFMSSNTYNPFIYFNF
jgi:alginate O-acetyltransferase complex protein AlgI